MSCEDCKRYYERGYTKACQRRQAACQMAHTEPRIGKRKAALVRKFFISEYQAAKITQPFLDQLEHCKDDDARRVLLGVSA